MIGLSTAYFAVKGFSIYESVKKTVELGFDVVELGAAHAFEENAWETLREIRKEFRNINFTIHTLFPPLEKKIWFNPADGLNELNKEIVDRLFRSASIIEAILISIHPAVFNEVVLGERAGRCNFDIPIVADAKDKKNSTYKFKQLMEYVNEQSLYFGIKVIVENLDTNYMNTYPCTKQNFSEIFKRFNNTGLLLDVGHALKSGNLSELMELHEHIYEIHLHDVGDISEDLKLAHKPIKDLLFFEPLKEIFKKSVVLIFEHGADVSESEIILEKELLEKFKGELQY